MRPARHAWRHALAMLALLCAHAAWARSPSSCPPAAQAPTPAERQQAEAAAIDRGFLWRIDKAGHSSWLYGTLHIGSLATALPGPAARDALSHADVLALEIDMSDPDVQRRLIRSLQGNAPAKPLPAALAARLLAQITAACLDAASMQRMPPLLQITSLNALVARRDGLDPSFGVDTMLGTAAREAGKPVLSLETPESQVALLTGFSVAEEREQIRQGLADLESGRARQLMLRTAKVWTESRLDELTHYTQWCDCARDDKERRTMARLLDERNLVMAQEVARLHDEGRSLFVAVGSLHMIGPEGLPALLRGQGFEVERITPR